MDISLATIFEYKVFLSLELEVVLKPNDVGMSDLFEYCYFIFDKRQILNEYKPYSSADVPLDFFQGHYFLRFNLLSFEHSRERALAYLLQYAIVID